MSNCEICQLISQKIFNQKEFYCNVLKSTRNLLQEYAVKSKGFHSRI